MKATIAAEPGWLSLYPVVINKRLVVCAGASGRAQRQRDDAHSA